MGPRSLVDLPPLKVQSNEALYFQQKQKQHFPFQNAIQSSSRAIGPIAILGGTASIYSAALSHSSSTLTPISVLYLLLLALNYSIMPRLSKGYIHPKTNKKSIALVEEVVKFGMGVGGFLLTEQRSNISNILLNQWTIQSTLLAAGLPSTLYAIQGVLTYNAYQNLDSVTFNGLTQMKTFSAALCTYLVLGKIQSPTQIVALGLLSVSTVVFQGGLSKDTAQKLKGELRRLLQLSGSVSGSGSGRGSDVMGKKNDKTTMTSRNDEAETKSNADMKRVFLLGIVPCLGATFLSGLAGAFSQKSLQLVVGSMQRGAYFYSAEISLCSAIVLLCSMASERFKSQSKSTTSAAKKGQKNSISRGSSSDGTCSATSSSGGYFAYWTWKTFIPILVKAFCGILTALVHKHSGSVMKGFSLVLGLVFSALLQTVLDNQDLNRSQFAGTALVLLSSWLHFTSPPS